MRETSGLIGAFAVTFLLGCGESRERPWHEPLPSIVVQLDSAAGYTAVLTKVEAVPAPEIRFPALVQPDPNHVAPVYAPVTGVLVRIVQQQPVRRGETLAVMGLGSAPAGREVTVRAENAGTWRPRRETGQTIWETDTLGLVEAHGYLWAVGGVSEADWRFVHRDDPATVLIGDEADGKQLRLPGRVEFVRGPGPSSFSADVAVEFQNSAAHASGGATVVVRPSGPGDSLAAVPASAVVHLPLGSAVFVPAGTGRYEVRWVTAGPSTDGKIVVRDGLRPMTSVVARDLALLLDAARDSLARRGFRTP